MGTQLDSFDLFEGLGKIGLIVPHVEILARLAA
jgi:hypothetical protein